MAFELEALVGHLYIAGGRTIKTAPPGTICEVAPKRAARGREIDTFFTLVLPSGNIAPNTFYEQMALMAAERYFSNTGSVTSALRDVYNTLNNNLYEHNQSGRKPYEANMICAVLRAKELFIARAGAATMVLHNDGETKLIPSPLNNEDALFKPPLGVQPIPEVEMTRFPLEAGARMLLADANLAEIPQAKIDNALAADDMEALLDEYKMLVTLQIQMVAVEFVLPDEPVHVPAVTGQSSAVLAAEIAAARAKAAAEQAAALAESSDNPESSSRSSARNRLRERFNKLLIGLSRIGGYFFSTIGDLLNRILGSDDGKRLPTGVLTLAMIGFPALVIVIVLLSWVLNVGQTAFEECVARAADAAQFARSLDSAQRDSVIAGWQSALTIVEECDDLREDNDDPTLFQIRTEGQSVLDQLNNITRRRAIPVWASPDEGANISTLVRQGLDLYVLDSNTNLVYRVQLASDGTSLANTPQPIANMRTGARVESLGLNIGPLVDIAFDSENNLIAALDRNGVLIRCRPLFINQCNHQQLQGTENWVNPVAFTYYLGNLYVMDIASGGNGQIWRYEPIGGDNYSALPIEYFRASVRPDLSLANDFAISSAANTPTTRGTIYVLREDGVISAFYQGEPQPFAFSPFPVGQELSVVTSQAMYLNDSPIDTGFYIVSRPARTIYETTAAGTFVASYRVFDESLFERLNDVVADAEQGIIYAASGNAIFAIRKDQ
jgi:hypothetical protein